METRFILSSVRREAEKLGASGDILSAVRLSGSVNGDRGEGYLLLYQDAFVLLCRKLGERDYTGIVDVPGAWRPGAVREAQYQISLEIIYDEQTYNCVFPPSERADAEKILTVLREAAASGETGYSVPMQIFAALLVSLSNADHSEGLRRILDAGAIAAGRRYAAQTTLPELVERAAGSFTDDQKKALIFNLIELRMSDGLWSSDEQKGLGELAQALGWSDAEFREAAHNLLIKNNYPALFE